MKTLKLPKTTLLLLLIFSSLFTQAQEPTKIIVDATTNKPVSFATIKVLGKPKGVIASEKGEYALNVDPADSILITCVGYTSKAITGKDITPIIYLEPRVKSLENITVHSSKLLRTLVIGRDTSKLNNDLNWGPGGKAEFAQRMDLPDSSRLYKLKKVFVRIKKHRCYGPLLLHIYVTDTNRTPGEEILTKIVYFNKSNVKKNKGTIDLSSDNINWKDTKSFFIGFSWLTNAWEEQCLTTLFYLPSASSSTFSRTITSYSYNWFPFYWTIDHKPSPATTFFSAEVDELNSQD